MEFSHIHPHGYSVHVIFNGSNYFFYSDWCGLIAIAERATPIEERNKEVFNLVYGNEHLSGGSLGGSVLESIAKRFISKAENKYITKKCEYNVTRADLSNHYLKIEALGR